VGLSDDFISVEADFFQLGGSSLLWDG
jgi:hypothetical protein